VAAPRALQANGIDQSAHLVRPDRFSQRFQSGAT